MSQPDKNHANTHIATFTFLAEDLVGKHNSNKEVTEKQKNSIQAHQHVDEKLISNLSTGNGTNQFTQGVPVESKGSNTVVKDGTAENIASEPSEIENIMVPSIKTKTLLPEDKDMLLESHENSPENRGIDSLPLQTETNIAYPTSPTGSISSLLSTESTRKLIKNLSVKGLADSKEQQPATGENLQSSLGTSPVLPKNDKVSGQSIQLLEHNEFKKPIKFTVRKVSREGIPSQDEKRGNIKPVSHRYGNLPENRAKVVEHKMGDKVYQIKQHQAKYDEYVTRIEKIDKEIRFLTTLLPPYNVEIDYATRLKITRAIEKLGCKKDEIDKKKYELGMSISRLWREFDDNNTWVRSVSKH